MVGALEGGRGGGGVPSWATEGPPPPPPAPGEAESNHGQERPQRRARHAPGEAGPPPGRLPAAHLGTALVTESRRRGERSAARMAVHGRGNLTGRNSAQSVLYPE